MPRNRTISPSEALFASLNATGSQSTINQIHRVQSVNYGTSTNRTPVGQFAQQASIDNVILEPQAVSLDFSYLVTNALNEANLGFVVDGSAQAISGYLSKQTDERNYYILTVEEGEEAFGGDTDPSGNAVIGIGNGFLAKYGFEAQVGQFPSASVSVEALNQVGYASSAAQASPAINPITATRVQGQPFTIPATTSGVNGQATALRPGDVYLTLTNPAYGVNINDAKIQNVKIDIDLGREPLNKLGSLFPFSRELTFPINVSVSVEANVGDLTTGSLSDVLCDDKDYNIVVGLRKPSCPGATGTTAIEYSVRGAKLDSQSFSSALNSNKTVSLQWTAQIGGPRDTARGFFISGTLT
jgi:hypothetical protein